MRKRLRLARRRSRAYRPTPAMTVALLALFIVMAGSAVAGSRYLINSTGQINPKVLKKLRGQKGQPGPPGKEGAQGKEGPAGKEGKQGREGKEGREGTEAAGGSALALAFMDRTGELKDVRNFSPKYARPEEGIYCLTPSGGVSSSASPIAMVTVERSFSVGADLRAYANVGAEQCGKGQYEVMTFAPGLTLSNNVAFYIEVPG
jgi:hypothetical protein